MRAKILLSLSVAASLVGCAATMQPQQAVNQLDQRGEKYETQECRTARQVALTYDDNVAGRMGLGLGAGLLLGPFGIPFAIAADASQAKKREAVLTELKRHCGAIEQAANSGPAGVSNQTAAAETLSTEHTECIPYGYKAGDKLTLRGLGDVTVKQLSSVNTQCALNGSPPVQAVVVSTKTPMLFPISTAQPAAPRTEVRVSAETPATAKLRELNGMLRDGLITQQEYDGKKAEVLRNF